MAEEDTLLTRGWESLRSLFYYDDFYMTVIGTNILLISWFWLVNAVYLFVDLTGKPAWFLKYKVQAAKQVPADAERVREAVVRALFNQFCLTIPLTVLTYPLGVYLGCTSVTPLPSVWRVIRDVIGIIIIEEFTFYYSHRLLHTPWLYKHVHKMHHDWTAPMGIISIYARPLEHIVSNFMAELMGPLLMGSHLAVTWGWLLFALFATIGNHSGYAIPHVTSPHFHDYHHEKFTGNFGSMKFLDWFHGTDKLYRQTMELRRKKELNKTG